MKIQGTEGMSTDEIRFEVQRGAKFVFFYYSVSVLVMSFRRASPVYFIPRDKMRSARGCLGSCSRWSPAGGASLGGRSTPCSLWL
jgi:hypothetical protein